MIIFEEKISGLEAIGQRLKEVWGEEVSLPSINQVLMENGLRKGEAIAGGIELTSEDLFYSAREEQLGFDFDGVRKIDGQVIPEEENEKDQSADKGAESLDGLTIKARARDEYSRGQGVYLDVLEQGDYNAYAGGLLFAPLLKRKSFFTTLRDVLNMRTYYGYSLEELCLTLFYFDVFGFQSLEDFPPEADLPMA